MNVLKGIPRLPQLKARTYAAALTAAFVMASVLLTSLASNRGENIRRSDEHADEFEAQVSRIEETFTEETLEVEAALTSLIREGSTLPAGSAELLDLETSGLLASNPAVLRLTLLGVATPAGEYTSMGTNGMSGRLAEGIAKDDQLVFQAIDGGPPTVIPGFNITERPWFTAAVTRPDEFHWSGPTVSYNNGNLVVVSIAEPGSGLVFSAAVDVSRFAALAELSSMAAGLDASLVVNRPDADEAETSSLVGSLDPSLIDDTFDGRLVDGAGPLVDRAGRLSQRVELLPNSSTLTLVLSSVAPAPVPVSWPALLLFAALFAAVAAAVAAGLTSVAMRHLSKNRVTQAPDGTVHVERVRSCIQEFDQLNESAVAWTDKVAETFDEAKASSVRVAALYEKFATRQDLHAQWLATQLHDGPLQLVAAARLSAEGAGTPAAADIAESLREAERGMRTLAADLVPHDLVANGLEGALRTLAESASTEQVDVGCFTEDADPLGRQTQRLLLRCAQELVNNAIKHSHGTRVTVALSRLESAVVLSVSDNGVGFAQSPSVPDGGFGLMSIRVQVTHFGGELEIADRSGSGSVVTVTLPAPSRRESAHDDPVVPDDPRNLPPLVPADGHAT